MAVRQNDDDNIYGIFPTIWRCNVPGYLEISWLTGQIVSEHVTPAPRRRPSQ